MDPELEPNFSSEDSGFTLVELLVSIAVLAVLALGATLALPRGSAPAQSDMALFQRQFEQMRQLAITSQSSRGLIITSQGLRLASRQASSGSSSEGQNQSWRHTTRLQPWQGRVHFVPQDIQSRAPIGSGLPDIQFLADGRSSAFSIRFSQRAGSSGSGLRAAQASCRSDGSTGLICDSL